MPLPTPESIDTTKSYVVHGETFKELLVVIRALWYMTNNNANSLSLRTVNVCVGNTVKRMDVIGSEPRAGL